MIAWLSSFEWGSLASASPIPSLLLKATLALAAALAADVLLARKFPLACAAIWNGVLLALAVLPVAWLALPAARTTRSASPIEGSRPYAAEAAATRTANVVSESAAPSVARSLPNDEGNGISLVTEGVHPFSAAMIAVYAIGCGVGLLRLLHGLRAVVRLRRSSSEIAGSRWNERLDHWRTQCGIASPVALKTSPTVNIPLVIGHPTATIVLPTELAECADDKTRDAILVHELAHVARRDFAWQLLERTLGVALWFHPLFWLAERRLRYLRERVCDEFAVHRLGSASDYIETLLEMAARLTRSPAVALGMAVLRSSHLGERLAAIRDSRGYRTCRAGRGLRLATLASALTLAGWFGRSAIADPEVPRIEGLTADAQTLLDEFDADAQRLRDEAERKIAAKRTELERQLRALQTHYTREDKLDEAVAIRDQIRLLRAATIAEGTPLTILSDPGNMYQYAQSVGKSYFVRLVGSNTSSLWGTDEYTHDSSVAAAAVHAGVLRVGEMGVVKVTMLPGRDIYTGSNRNGTSSNDWQNTSGSYVSFKVERAPPEIEALAKARVRPEIPTLANPGVPVPLWDRNRGNRNRAAMREGSVVRETVIERPPYFIDAIGLGSKRAHQGQSFEFQVTGAADPSAFVWGTDVYTDDSSLSAAAVHAGAVRPGETAIVRVTILPGRANYEASDRNGVTSHAWGSFGGSFSVKRVGGRTEPGDR